MLQLNVKVCETVQLFARFLQCNAGKLEKCFSSFTACSNQNRSAQVCELLSDNSLFVGQLCDDKFFAPSTHDLIFTTDLQTVIYCSTNHC